MKTPSLYGLVLLAALMLSNPVQSQAQQHIEHHTAAPSPQNPYAGQQIRNITSLSADDQKALGNGEGWGLAKPAELNGVPGPVHLIELAKEIGLTTSQVEKLKALYEEMKVQAIALGKDYIAKEKALDDYFRSGQFRDLALREKVDQAAQALANLRFLHLSYHHRTLNIVTPEQVTQYNQLRGYSQVINDPCATVPPGHDPDMFRKHMGCK